MVAWVSFHDSCDLSRDELRFALPFAILEQPDLHASILLTNCLRAFRFDMSDAAMMRTILCPIRSANT